MNDNINITEDTIINVTHDNYTDNDISSNPLTEEEIINNKLFGINKTVFTHGLPTIEYLKSLQCSVCFSDILMIQAIYKRRIFSKDRVLKGYVKICAKCGNIDIFTRSIKDYKYIIKHTK